MKVKELIKELRQFNGEMEVCFNDKENGDQIITFVSVKFHPFTPTIPYVLIEWGRENERLHNNKRL